MFCFFVGSSTSWVIDLRLNCHQLDDYSIYYFHCVAGSAEQRNNVKPCELNDGCLQDTSATANQAPNGVPAQHKCTSENNNIGTESNYDYLQIYQSKIIVYKIIKKLNFDLEDAEYIS